MKRVFFSLIAAIIGVSSAQAADLPVKAPPLAAPVSPWDWAFGGALMSDYNFRGISQSDRGPSVTAYSEARYNINANWQLYAGAQYWAVTLPTDPSCECDLYAGIRPTVGPIAFDFGFIYYWYPKEKQLFIDPTGAFLVTNPVGNTGIFTLNDTDFWEVYGKATWEAIKDRLAFGANVYYSPSWLNSGAFGTYASLTAKVTLPSFNLNLGMIDQVGWYLSGEVGHYWLGTSDPILGSVNYPDYTFWNAGLAFTWKVATLDLRYYDTDLSKTECFIDTGDPKGFYNGGTSKWCSATFIAALKFDLTLANLK
jgi:uncharacterized protein (TIGR02001 family)